MTARVLLVARNTFRAIMSKRALYVWTLALVMMFLRAAPAIFASSLEPSVLFYLRANAVSASMELWAVLCIGAAILLGAGSVAGEISTKTIVTMLARPIHRWEVLLGKWLGVTAFALLSLAIGVILDTAVASYLDIEMDRRILGVALAHTVAAIMLFGAVAVVIGSGGSAVLAVAITALLIFIPGLVDVLKDEPRPVPYAIGRTFGILTPAGYGSHYNGMTWAPFPRRANARGPAMERPRAQLDYPAARRQMLENIGYAAAYFVLGCVFFTRKDVQLG
jgi:hypothetical protein